MSNKIGKGLDPKMLGVAAALAAFGLFMAYVGFFTDRGVRLGPVPIPLSIVGPLLVVAALGVGVFSFRQEKCLACNKALESTLVHYPAELGATVAGAVMNGDVQILSGAPFGDASRAHTQVSLEACPQCQAIGVLEVCTFTPEQSVLVPKRVIEGPLVRPLVTALASREAAAEAAASHG